MDVYQGIVLQDGWVSCKVSLDKSDRLIIMITARYLYQV